MGISAGVRTTFTGISETIGQGIPTLKSKPNGPGAVTRGLWHMSDFAAALAAGNGRRT